MRRRHLELFFLRFIITCLRNFVSVIKRLENVQVNLVDVSNKEELLNVSRNLRVQQEKTKELENQVKLDRVCGRSI